VPVLASQASLTPYLEEGGLALASAGAAGVAGEVAGVVGAAGVGLHPTGSPGDRTIN